jgi:hypothetical protein
MTKNIYRIKKDKPDLTKPIKTNVVFFTLSGKEDLIDEDGYPILTSNKVDLICAKLNSDGDHHRYFVRRDGDGSFYNPSGLYSEGYMTRTGRRVSKPELDFRTVNKNVFYLYLQFLKTKNEAWLRNAERSAM